MLNLIYAPIFVRQFNKLNSDLQEEVLEKLEMFKNISSHKILRVHKLNGILRKKYSFSVNYTFRIVFSYNKKTIVNILAVGDHNIYK